MAESDFVRNRFEKTSPKEFKADADCLSESISAIDRENGLEVEQTTKKVNETQQQGFLNIIEDYRRQNEALRKRVAFLEKVLAQRGELTKSKYAEKKRFFNPMQDMAYKIFLENPAIGFTYEEIIDEWQRRYPHINNMNVPRRVRELAEQGLLWRSVDPETRKVKHFLKFDGLSQENKNKSRQKTLGEM